MRKNLVILAGLTMTTLGHAALVEDGSSFTGKYRVQEVSCEKQVTNPQTGKEERVAEFTFQGTPGGLVFDGNLQKIQQGDPEAAGPDSGVTVNSNYISSSEFRSEGVTHFETDGANPPVTRYSEDFRIDTSGNITMVTKDSDGQLANNKVCHFIREN